MPGNVKNSRSCEFVLQSNRDLLHSNTSALPLKADIHGQVRHVSKVPKAEVVALFNDLVGSCEQGRRQFEAERFGGLEVDNQIKLGRLLDRDISGFTPA